MSRFHIITLIFCLSSVSSFGQRNVEDSVIATPWVSVQYGFNFTDGDLKSRHGHFNHIGFFGGYKTKKNWIYGVDASYMFGNDIRVNGLFADLADDKFTVTDQNGDIATVVVASRGLHANLTVGKIFPVFSPNKNSGIYVNGGLGFLAHKIRIETQDHVVPVLELNYRKGYDRLTQGVNAHQFIGYAFMANQGFVNLYGGFYFQEGYTFNRREIFFDTPETPVSKDPMLDIQYGIRIGWLIPIYKRQPKEFYFN